MHNVEITWNDVAVGGKKAPLSAGSVASQWIAPKPTTFAGRKRLNNLSCGLRLAMAINTYQSVVSRIKTEKDVTTFLEECGLRKKSRY